MEGFDFVSPKSLNAALRAIDGKGKKYKLLAGGTNLIPNLREGNIHPGRVVDLGGIKALNYIKERNGQIRIGALTTIADLLNSRVIEKHVPVLWEAARQFAGPLVRNRATVGGNLVDASPAADSAVPLLALKAQGKLRSLSGRRTVALAEFFTGYRKTAIRPGEILTEVAFAIPAQDTKQYYRKLGRRNAMAISVISLAMVLEVQGKTCKDAAIALGAVSPTPSRARKAEALLKDKEVDVDLAQKCGKVAAESVRPIDDLRASAHYRRQVCEALIRRLVCQSLDLRPGIRTWTGRDFDEISARSS